MSVGVVLGRHIMSQVEVFKWEQVDVVKISPDDCGGGTLSHMLRELWTRTVASYTTQVSYSNALLLDACMVCYSKRQRTCSGTRDTTQWSCSRATHGRCLHFAVSVKPEPSTCSGCTRAHAGGDLRVHSYISLM